MGTADEDTTKRAKLTCSSTAQLAKWLKASDDDDKAVAAFAPQLPSPSLPSAGPQQHGDTFDALYAIVDGSSVQAVAYNVVEPALPLPTSHSEHTEALVAATSQHGGVVVSSVSPRPSSIKTKKTKKRIGTLKRKDEPCLDISVRGSMAKALESGAACPPAGYAATSASQIIRELRVGAPAVAMEFVGSLAP